MPTSPNETALIAFSVLSGIASGVGGIILAKRLREGGSCVDNKSLIAATVLSFGATLLSVFIIKSSLTCDISDAPAGEPPEEEA